MSKFKLGLDMDGILANWAESAINKINMLWDLNLIVEDLQMYNTRELVEREAIKKHGTLLQSLPLISYSNICSPGFFREIKPYPQARNTVEQLAELGKIVIVTKPLEWQYCPQEKIDWLKEYLYDIDYTVIMVQHAEHKGLLNLDFMIDDDPRVIKSLPLNTTGIMVQRPWNKEFIHKTHTPVTLRFADVPTLVKQLIADRETHETKTI